jgi:hypothetical protein
MVVKDRVTVDSKMNMIVVSEHRGQKVLGRADVMEVSGGATGEGRELPKPYAMGGEKPSLCVQE